MSNNDDNKPVDQAFTKYITKGAYHWRPWYRRTLHHHARYLVAHRLLAQRLDLERAAGIDVGSGDGRFIYYIRNHSGNIIGFDSSLSGLNLSRQMLGERGLYRGGMICGSCYQIPLGDNVADYVVALELFEHLERPKLFLGEVRRILRTNGWLVMSSPRRRPDGGRNQVRDAFHVREYISSEIQEMVSSGFDDVEVFGGNPRWLVGLLERVGGESLVGKIWRGMVRSISAVIGNPFVYVLSKNPNRKWECLYLRCRRSE